ncbi:DegV family protein [Streptococcus hongkongensis]|nr:DegV domain protein [Streptococcus uberis]
MKLAVITDNTSYLPDSLTNKDNLFVLDIPIMIDGETFYEGKNITLDDFYTKMASSAELPKTSQPALSELDELLTQLENDGYSHVIGLFLAAGISGFWANCQFLVEEHPQLTIAFPDSKLASVPVCNMILNIFKWYEEDFDFQTIISHLQIQIDHSSAFILVDDLNHLVKGGRLSNGSALLGNLLNIKPVLRFDNDGKIVVFEKVRTEKKALKRLVDIINDINETGEFDFSIINANAKEKATLLKEMIIDSGLDCEFTEANFSAVIGTHLGSGAVAIGFSPKM